MWKPSSRGLMIFGIKTREVIRAGIGAIAGLLFAFFIFGGAVAFGQNNGGLLPALPPQFQNAANGKLCTQAAGTTTALATYSDNALTSALPTVISLNALGRPTTSGGTETAIYLQARSYKISLYAAGSSGTCNGQAVGALVWTRDNVYDLATFYKSVFATLLDDKVCHASQVTAATPNDMGGKITYCINSVLPSGGGTVDARGLEGAQTWSNDPLSGITKNVTLIIGASTITVSASATAVSSVSIQAEQGAIFSVSAGKTLTIAGGFDGTLSQHFSGSGTVALATPTRTAWLYPEWFGAVRDGSTDDYAAWQSAVNAGNTKCETAGTSILSSRISIPSNRRIQGSWACTLKVKDAAGATTHEILYLEDVSNVTVDGMHLDGNKANQSDNDRGVGIYCYGCQKATFTNNLIENMTVFSLEISKNETSTQIPTDVVFANNTSVNPSRNATFNQHLAVTGGRKITIANNVCESTDGYAATMIDLEPNNAGNPIEDVTITGNVGRQVNGVFLNSAYGKIIKRVTVSGNSVLGTGAGAGNLYKILGATIVTFSGNVADTAGSNGLLIDSSDTISVTGNIFNNFGTSLVVGSRTGIRCTSSQGITVAGNTIVTTVSTGIGIDETTSDCVTFVGINRIDVPGTGTAYSMMGANSTIMPNFDNGGAPYGTWTLREARADTSVVTGTWSSGTLTQVASNGNWTIQPNTLRVNPASGTDITGYFSATASIDFAAWSGGDCQQGNVAVSAASVGDDVVISVPDALAATAGVQFTAWVSAAGNVVVRGCKVTSGASADPAAATIRASVWHH